MRQNIGMPKHVAPNWSALLKEMRATGMTQTEIAVAVGLSQATVSEMISGDIKTTEYTKGLKIIAAHKAAMKRKPAQAAA
jgi:predicted transcriptional regulator